MMPDNLPDCSNILPRNRIGRVARDHGRPSRLFRYIGRTSAHADAIFFFGQNVGSNSPRMLHDLQEARRRGVPIVTFNPLHERGLQDFTNPQSPTEMLTGNPTQISTQFHQVKSGGDMAAIMGMCKALIAWDDAKHNGNELCWTGTSSTSTRTDSRNSPTRRAPPTGSHWSAHQGLTRNAMEAAALVYSRANAVIGIYGMGLTQHVKGVQSTVQTLVNLLLLRDGIGKRERRHLPGARPLQCARAAHRRLTGKPELNAHWIGWPSNTASHRHAIPE